MTAGSNAVEGAAALLRAVDAKLDRAVDRLAKQANSSAGAVHVVTTGGGGSSSYSPQSTFSATTVVLALVAAGGTVAAVVLWRGKYVTREHFSSAVHAVTDWIKAVSRTVEVLKSNMREGFVSLTGFKVNGIRLNVVKRIVHKNSKKKVKNY